MPRCEVEFEIEAVDPTNSHGPVRLRLREYIDGPVPDPYLEASRVGWTMVLRGLKAQMEGGGAAHDWITTGR